MLRYCPLFILAMSAPADAATFGDDLAFLKKHTEVVVLSDASGQARVAVAPTLQGRIMTSTATGSDGTSFGWVNRELIASGRVQPQINAFGGEDRFWVGPEGGQFSVFFAKGAPFELAHWFTPAAVDTEPFTVVSQTSDRLICRHAIELTNYSGTKFSFEVTREVRLQPATDALLARHLRLPPGVSAVAFESINTIKNTGTATWRKDTGLLSIWILGMFNSSSSTTVVIPVNSGPQSELGPVVNDSYYGKVPADRLLVNDSVVYFRGDAKYRSKIGISPRRARSWLGSYDAERQMLTLVSFTKRDGATDYVNSMWGLQEMPFAGDLLNSYNDGPPQPGAAQLGQFYELESSSPALALVPGASATHVHQTIHIQGDESALDTLSRTALGAGINQIQKAVGSVVALRQSK